MGEWVREADESSGRVPRRESEAAAAAAVLFRRGGRAAALGLALPLCISALAGGLPAQEAERPLQTPLQDPQAISRAACFFGGSIALEQATGRSAEWGGALGLLCIPDQAERWHLRGEATAGSSTRLVPVDDTDARQPFVQRRLLFGGVQGAVARAWRQDLFGSAETRLDPYVVLGGGVSYYRDARTIAQRDPVAPYLLGGVGLARFPRSADAADRSVVTVEVVREQRFRGWDSRTQVRLGMAVTGFFQRLRVRSPSDAGWWRQPSPALPDEPRTFGIALRRPELQHHVFSYWALPRRVLVEFPDQPDPSRPWTMRSDAVRYTQEALARQPDDLVLTHQLGALEALDGRHRQALQAYRRALQVGGDDRLLLAVVHADMGVVFAELGLADSAQVHLDLALQANPNLEAALVNRGLLLEELGRGEDAVAAYRSATERLPRSVAAWENLAYALVREDRPEEALTALRQGLEFRLTSDEPAILDDKRRLCGALGLYRELTGEDLVQDAMCVLMLPLRVRPLLPRR